MKEGEIFKLQIFPKVF